MQLDHLVYGVPDLARGVEVLSGRLGAVPRPGGRHEALGTHNAILPLAAGAYVELIAPDPEAPPPAGPRPFGLDDLDAARLVTWAASVDGIEAAAERARKAGYDPGAVVPVARETPEGERLSWRLTLRADTPGGGLVPFLIDWGSTPHPSGGAPAVCRLEGFAGEHPEPEIVRGMLRALGAPLAVERGPVARLRATVVGPRGSFVLG